MAQVPGGRLTPVQLAFEASAPVELIDELVAGGAIKRHGDGTHEPEDVARVRLAHALASGGISVADIVHEIDTGNMPFSEIPRLGIVPQATGRTFAEFAAPWVSAGRCCRICMWPSAWVCRHRTRRCATTKRRR